MKSISKNFEYLQMQLKNKCALVTGGANRIGYLCVKQLLDHGAKVRKKIHSNF